MLVNIKFGEIGDLVILSQFSGAAPCQILAINRVKSEQELVGKIIKVPMNLATRITPIKRWYEEKDGGIVTSG